MPKMQRKVFTFDNLKYKKIADEAGDEFLEFEGYLSTFGNIDHGNDVVMKGAFRESLKNRMPKLLWQHNWDEPIGIFTEIYEDEKGLYVKGKMPLADTLVKGRIEPQMKIRSIDSMSIGYFPNVSEYDYDEDIRYLKEVELFEGSLVTIPMNDEARIEVSKGFEFAGMDYIDEQKEIELVADVSYKWDAEKASERVDVKKDDKFDSGLNVCDMIDGKLHIIPRAVFCMKAKLLGAKGGFSDKYDIDRVKSFVNKLYLRLDMDKPFSSKSELIHFSKKELENMPLSETSFVLRSETATINKSGADAIARALMAGVTVVEESDESDEKSGTEAFEKIDKALNFNLTDGVKK